MAITMETLSGIVGKDVFTTKGVYCGKVSDVDMDLEKFRVRALVVDAVKGSFLANLVGDKKGVVVPYSMINAIGDIVIMKHVSPATVDRE